jgi:hypothetical protein
MAQPSFMSFLQELFDKDGKDEGKKSDSWCKVHKDHDRASIIYQSHTGNIRYRPIPIFICQLNQFLK